jgi:hypothetical protein
MLDLTLQHSKRLKAIHFQQQFKEDAMGRMLASTAKGPKFNP